MTLAISSVIVTLCIIADPYEIWHIYSRQGFNLYSVKGRKVERLTKPLNFILHNKNSQTIIFGSSRADFAMNPKHWENLTGRKTYNFAVTNTTVYEMRRYLEYSATNDKNLQEIILCVDFYSFVDTPEEDILKILPYKDEKTFEESLPSLSNVQKVLFSWDAIKDSYNNCKQNSKKMYDYPCHNLDGKYSEKHIENLYGKDNSKFFKIFNFWKKKINFSEVALKNSAFEDFQKIVELCAKNNLKLHVCILPLYPVQYECFNDCWNIYEEWKIRLSETAPIYDFTYFDKDLIQPENFWDSSHAKLIIGDKILNSIHSEKLEFGEIVTPENVKQHNKKILRQRKIWRKNHLTEIKQLEKQLKNSKRSTN